MPATDLHARIKAAVVQRIKGLNLPGIGERVFSQLAMDKANTDYPCVVCTTQGGTEEVLDGDTENFEWMLPVRVLLMDRQSTKDHELEAVYLGWRKALMDAFNQLAQRPKLPEVPGVYAIRVYPSVIVDSNLSQYQDIVSGMVLRFWATQRRN